LLSTTESQLAFWGLLLLAGVFSNKLSSRFNMPILLMFLGVGMIVGSDGFGIFNWNEAQYAKPINGLGMVAMSFILFSGGLSTRFRSIRPVLGRTAAGDRRRGADGALSRSLHLSDLLLGTRERTHLSVVSSARLSDLLD